MPETRETALMREEYVKELADNEKRRAILAKIRRDGHPEFNMESHIENVRSMLVLKMLIGS